MSEKPRFSTFFDGRAGHFITDESKGWHIMAHSFSEDDAKSIIHALNTSTISPRWRQLMATEIGDFRMKLEHENGGSLTQDPIMALLLDDLCNFLGFTSGEKSVALGASLLVYLSFISDDPTDSTLPVRDLVVGEELRVA